MYGIEVLYFIGIMILGAIGIVFAYSIFGDILIFGSDLYKHGYIRLDQSLTLSIIKGIIGK